MESLTTNATCSFLNYITAADRPADPSKLCPWCDDVLPDPISSHLASLIAEARLRSYASPRPGNVGGLEARIFVFSDVCVRHNVEKTDSVIGAAEGWPRNVDWEVFIQRVIKLQPQLQRIVDDVDEEWQPPNDDSTKRVVHEQKSLDEDPQALAKRPRKESFLWKSLVNSVARRGALYVSGINGQMDEYEKRLPG